MPLRRLRLPELDVHALVAALRLAGTEYAARAETLRAAEPRAADSYVVQADHAFALAARLDHALALTITETATT